MENITAKNILEALIAVSSDMIWASELAFFAGERRIDFFTLAPTASQKFRTSAFEIKVSRADFRRDTENKQAGALRWSDRFWYVTPPDLISRTDLPDWAGLQEWDGKMFRIVRKAPMRTKQDPDWLFVVSLLRNCGDSRRDIGLLKAQIAFLQNRVDQVDRIARIASDHKFRRWLAVSQERQGRS